MKSFTSTPQIQAYEQSGNCIVTPSRWSRERIIDYGFSEQQVFVIPHGVDTAGFYPFSKKARKSAREKLGYNEDDIVFLNVADAKAIELSRWEAFFDAAPLLRLVFIASGWLLTFELCFRKPTA